MLPDQRCSTPFGIKENCTQLTTATAQEQMPPDQRIRIERLGTVQGERQAVEHWNVWAFVADATADEVEADRTARQQLPGRDFTVRWIDAVAKARVASLRVVDSCGLKWDAKDVRINHRRGRRRFLTIRTERDIRS